MLGTDDAAYRAARDKVKAAFETALDNVGLHIDSYSLWLDYISFLEAGKVTATVCSNKLQLARTCPRPFLTWLP